MSDAMCLFMLSRETTPKVTRVTSSAARATSPADSRARKGQGSAGAKTSPASAQKPQKQAQEEKKADASDVHAMRCASLTMCKQTREKRCFS